MNLGQSATLAAKGTDLIDAAVLAESLPALARATIITIELTLASAALSLIFGTLSCMLQLSSIPGGYYLSRFYVSLMRGTPLLVQLFAVFFGMPLLGLKASPFIAAVFAIGLNSGAYTTEILRAAVQNVSRGHLEAAETIGMSKLQSWRRVILPQAFGLSLPALTNEFTIVLKSTSLASIVAVTELTYTGVLIQSRTFTALEILLPVAAFYIATALVFTQLSRRLERRLMAYYV